MSTAFDDVKAWPEPLKRTEAAPMGDNRPPPDEQARDEFNTKLDAALRKRSLTRARFDELIAQAERAKAFDEESTGNCGELVKSLRAASKLIDDVHTEVKAPYLAAGRELDGMKNTIKAPLDRAKKLVEDKQGVFLRKRDYAQRIIDHIHEVGRGMIGGTTYPFPILIRELEEKVTVSEADFGDMTSQVEAERVKTLARVREAFDRHMAEKAVEDARPEPAAATPATEFLADAGLTETAAPPAAEPEIIRGTFGAAVSGQKVWASEVENYEIAFISAGLATNEKVREAIDKAISGMVRAGTRQIEGVRIFQQLKASNR